MPRYHKLARKNAIHVTKDIMTAEKAAAISMHMNLADNLINPMNCPNGGAGQPTLPPSRASTGTPLVARNPPPENLRHMEIIGEPKNLSLHPNRPRHLPKSCTPTAIMNERAAPRDWFARKMDIETTASAKGETPNDDRMVLNSTTQRRDHVKNIHSNNMVLRTIDNAGASLANNRNQAVEAIKIEEASTPKWRLCSYCGVPGHPIGNRPMVPCRRCHTVGHTP